MGKPKRYSYACLDIETTGLSSSKGDLTVVGIYLVKKGERKVIQLVGDDITSSKLRTIVKQVNVLYTYNGSCFDLPFIRERLNVDLTRHCDHIDLMRICHRRDIYGGLKETERKLGIYRKLDMDGQDAVMLWYQYKQGNDQKALDTLLEYNKEDIVNLAKLKNKLNIKSLCARE